ncbi:hypothetical protein [Candidatus Frankia alpina]|nr:hypothetical protein [Candidatus Frankia alpina]
MRFDVGTINTGDTAWVLVHRLRVTPVEEVEEVDTTQHGEVAYRLF